MSDTKGITWLFAKGKSAEIYKPPALVKNPDFNLRKSEPTSDKKNSIGELQFEMD